MTDLLQVLVDFPTAQFSHLLPSLDKALITTSDLLTLDAIDIAKRAQLPPVEVGKLANAILHALHKDLGVEEHSQDKPVERNEKDEGGEEVATRGTWRTISTLDPIVDATLGGGIPTGYVTEITGERYVLDRWWSQFNVHEDQSAFFGAAQISQ
jgi:DNA repair protein RAD57